MELIKKSTNKVNFLNVRFTNIQDPLLFVPWLAPNPMDISYSKSVSPVGEEEKVPANVPTASGCDVEHDGLFAFEGSPNRCSSNCWRGGNSELFIPSNALFLFSVTNNAVKSTKVIQNMTP